MQDRIADVSRRVVECCDVRVELIAGRVAVHRRRYGARRARLASFLRLPTETTVRLDAMGSETWLLIDGRRSVAEILAELRRAHPDEKDIAERLGRFIGTMVSRQMVVLR